MTALRMGQTKCGLNGTTPRQASRPTTAIEFRTATSEIRNPDGSIVFRLDDIEVPAAWSQVATDVLAQKYFRKAGVPGAAEADRGERRPLLPVALGSPTRRRSPRSPRASDSAPRRDARQVFDRLAGTWTYWGWKGGYFDRRGGRARLLRRAPLHAGDAEGGAELAAMVQHRPALGLRHRRAEPGPLLRRPLDRRSWCSSADGLRAPAAACLLHPVASPTTSSTRAASWTSGCARRACSNTAPAPARISRACAAKASGCPAAASPPA